MSGMAYIRNLTYIPEPMAIALIARDVSAVDRCLREIYAYPNGKSFPMAMLQSLARIVRSKYIAFTEVDPVLGQSCGYLFPPGKWHAEDLTRSFQEHIHEHPVVQYAQRTRDGQAKAISDFLSARQFHGTQLYKILYAPMGIEDQLSITMLASAGLIIGLSFSRAKRGFSKRDRNVLNLLRPHLIQAYLNHREFEQLHNADGNQRGAVIDQLPLGFICIDSRGRIVWCTEPARDMLANHFTDAADSLHGLPDQLRVWLKSIGPYKAVDSATQRQISSRRSGFELRIRFCPLKDDQAMLLLQEHPLDAVGASLEQYSLTTRERHVMRCILDGNAVAEVSSRLSISARTVQKHLERVFQKLGVNSRSAACMKVLGTRTG